MKKAFETLKDWLKNNREFRTGAIIVLALVVIAILQFTVLK